MTIGEFSAATAADATGAAADARTLQENGQASDRGVGYVLSEEAKRAVDVAIALGRPLLVSGEPGCGKTTLGHAVARGLSIQRVHLFSVKSSSDASELFYSYDAVRRFRETQGGAGGEVGDYIEFQALGRAILDAHERRSIEHLLQGEANRRYRATDDPGPARSVVIIDEIDKAPSDFANDLLHEIEGLRFRVRELPRLDSKEPETPSGEEIAPHLRPIVVVTSNEERQLPDAFLRRCVFLEIPFPDPTTLSDIIDKGLQARLRRMLGAAARGVAPLDAARAKTLVDFFIRFRGLGPQKKPGVAELIDAAALLALSPGAGPEIVTPAVSKTRPDAQLAERAVK